jgi:drug/metabolite transporter (DMT)-like permease
VSTSHSRTAGGLTFAVLSAVSFALSGPLARGLLDTGWSPGAIVTVRIATATVIVLPFAVVSLRGRWNLLRGNAVLIVRYGILAVAGAQFCYFSAVQRLAVGPALLIEYTAPATVVVWLWLRHGQRPGPLTLLGAGIAALGLIAVLDLFSGAGLDAVGVLWALGAMVGLTSYFVLSADEDNGLPPLALAGGGLLVAAVLLGILCAVGALPFEAGTRDAVFGPGQVAWFLPLVALGVVTGAFAYVTGIAAGRRLGSRLASFVALLEVVAAVVFAWVLLDELPQGIQFAGGLLILAGVVVVKLGEGSVRSEPTVPSAPGAPDGAHREPDAQAHEQHGQRHVDSGERVLAVVPDQPAQVGLHDQGHRQHGAPEPQVAAVPEADEGDHRGHGGEHDGDVATAGVHVDPRRGGVALPVVLEEDPGPQPL